MKKYLFGAVFAFAVVVSPVFAQASSLTSTQIQAILSLLSNFGADSATIANVNSALTGSSSGGGGSQPWCHTFSTDLTVGSRGSDVAALITALSRSGIDTGTGSSDPSPLFDESVAAGVVKFQAKYGILQTGYVGPITRAKLNSLYGCQNPVPPPPSSTFSAYPTSGNAPLRVVFRAGVDWSSSLSVNFGDGTSGVLQNNCRGDRGACGQPTAEYTYSTAGIYTATLQDTSHQITIGTITITVINGTLSTGLSATIVAGKKSSYVAGENVKLSLKGVELFDGSTGEPSEGFNVQVYIRGTNDSYAQQSYNATYNSQTGYWDTQIVMPANTSRTYGLEASFYCSNSTAACGQRYPNGGQVAAGFTFSIYGSGRSQVMVTSPNGGESYQIGQPTQLPIRWTADCNNTLGFQVALIKGNELIHAKTDLVPQSNCSTGQTAVPYSMTWPISTTLTPGNDYKVLITGQNGNGGIGDDSDAPFSITSSGTTQPSITVISPNGGENFQSGGMYRIKWSSNNIGRNIAINLIDYTPGSRYGMQYAIRDGSTPYDNASEMGFNWSIPSNIPAGSYYKVFVGDATPNVASSGLSDGSDNYFTITAPTPTSTITVISPNGNVWQSGTTQTIQWTDSAYASNVLYTVYVTQKNGGGYGIITETQGTSVLWNVGTFPNGSAVPPLAPGESAYYIQVVRQTAPTATSFTTSPNASFTITAPPPASTACKYTGSYTSTINIEGGSDACRNWCSSLKAKDWGVRAYTCTYAGTQIALASTGGSSQTASVINAYSSATTPSTTNYSYTWDQDLQVGSPYAEDVKALQTVLTMENVYRGDITGGFYNQTFSAVQAFQIKYGIESTGYVGPITRAKLNELY